MFLSSQCAVTAPRQVGMPANRLFNRFRKFRSMRGRQDNIGRGTGRSVSSRHGADRSMRTDHPAGLVPDTLHLCQRVAIRHGRSGKTHTAKRPCDRVRQLDIAGLGEGAVEP